MELTNMEQGVTMPVETRNMKLTYWQENRRNFSKPGHGGNPD
jgi:hypothetical protein